MEGLPQGPGHGGKQNGEGTLGDGAGTFRGTVSSVSLATLRTPSACNFEAMAGSRDLGRKARR